ncbi:MAG: ABC transporter permease, partial [Gemmatimonadetes bacterium]|nr:ABC transporter permease [Gemmatimonadota bacterium]
ALGASRLQLVRVLLSESLLLTTLGALVGFGLARAGLVWFEGVVGAQKNMPWWADFRLAAGDLVFVMALTLVATAAIGLGPALKITRGSLADVLKQQSGTLAGLRFGRLSAAMVIAQFAIAVACVGAAGAVGRGLLGFTFAQYGFPAENIVVSQVYFGRAPIPEGATSDARRAASERHAQDSMRRLERIEAALRTLPGVANISIASAFPGNEVDRVEIQVEGDETRRHTTRVIDAGPQYFEILAAAPVAGRDFLPTERASGTDTAIVNEPFARKYFPGASPLGRRIRQIDAATGIPVERWREIVGVVRDLGVNPGDPQRADAVYVPFGPTTVLRIAIQMRGGARDPVPGLLALTAREAPAAQVQWSVTLEEQMSEVVAIFRRIGVLLIVVGGV